MKIHYNNDLKQFSRNLRNNSTYAEVLLWQQIKGRKIRGYQFARQKPIGKYVADFYCSKLKLVIEIDGISHIGKEEKDKVRQDYLESIGLNVIRFLDDEVKTNMEAVLKFLNDRVVKYENDTSTTP
jgi:very-short-patch-repair endonuclease